MKNREIYFTTIAIVALIISQCIWVGCNLAPGSYPYAEQYKLDIDEETLIKHVQNFKNKNPQYIIPNQAQLEDGKHEDDGGHWYHIYFYYPKENQIIHTWIRLENKTKTTFALVGVSKGLTLGNWKEINKDFSSSENLDEKNKFEERILSKIKNSL